MGSKKYLPFFQNTNCAPTAWHNTDKHLLYAPFHHFIL